MHQKALYLEILPLEFQHLHGQMQTHRDGFTFPIADSHHSCPHLSIIETIKLILKNNNSLLDSRFIRLMKYIKDEYITEELIKNTYFRNTNSGNQNYLPFPVFLFSIENSTFGT